ncbi:hypothetical protein BWD07_09240 [Neisseria canis]|nr:hypothetical protein BWD07_09240 [Neisseria canis]
MQNNPFPNRFKHITYRWLCAFTLPTKIGCPGIAEFMVQRTKARRLLHQRAHKQNACLKP